MKKGFTLIELLAVIVILAIIALIVTPIVSKVIDSAKQAAFKSTINSIIDSANAYRADYTINNNKDISYPSIITCDGEECLDDSNVKLEFKGKVPLSGRIIIESPAVIRADLITDGKLCGSGEKGKVRVYEDCNSIDETAPEINTSKESEILIVATTNSITVSIPTDLMYDNDTGISGYRINLYKSDERIDTKKYEEPNVLFTELESNTEYKIVIDGRNGVSGSTTIDRTTNTLEIVNPTMTYVNNPSSSINGYFVSQTIKTVYSNSLSNGKYYIKSTRDASTSSNTVESCGNGDNPSTCTADATTSITANTWYRVSGNIDVIYNVENDTEATLTAAIYDGDTYRGSTVKTVSKIIKVYDASEIEYSNEASVNNCNNVSCALDELYDMFD